MRVATWNLLHGRSLSDGLVDLARLRAAAVQLGPDVVGLQEVDRAQPRSHCADLTAEVAAALGVPGWSSVAAEPASPGWRFVPAIVGTPGGVWRAREPGEVVGVDVPAYGIGLVSRLPVRSWHEVALPKAPVRSPILIPGARRPVLLEDEPRAGLAAVVEWAGGVVTVATTHLSFVPGWGAVQLRRLVRGLADLPRPLLLVGDMNMPANLPARIAGYTNLARAKTHPSPDPRYQLDHVLGTGPLPRVLSVESPLLPVSDHRPLLVQLG